MRLQATYHSYYCSETNYYVGNHNGENFGRSEYDTWEEFKEEWLDKDGTIDCDYNLCFRYDITQNRDEETDEPIEGYRLWLFFILQRKGIYRPVWIKNIGEGDMAELEKFLQHQWNYITGQWSEIAEGAV